MAASSGTDCPLTNLVFDLRNHNEATSERLLSAADFFLRDIFDNPPTDPITYPLTGTEFPFVYMVMGEANCATFIAAKLFALNMLHLEDAIIKYCSDGDLLRMSDEELNSIIEEVQKLKEQKNQQDKEPTYSKGTGLSVDIISDVMEAKFFEDDSSSDLCHICKKELMYEMVSTLPYCQHEFHTRCIERKLCENTLCPLCQNWALPIQAEYPNWIKDCEKVREFLTRDSSASFLGQRYTISLSVLHALMAVHLQEVGLNDVFKSFQRQIHTIIDERHMIRKEVVEFLKDCIHSRYIEEGLVKRFHSFMEMTLRALCFDDVHQNEFRKRMREVNVHELKYWSSIKNLSRFTQAVEYVQGGV